MRAGAGEIELQFRWVELRARRLDAPGIDCLTSLPPEVPWYIARLLASAAEVEGLPRLEHQEQPSHHRRPQALAGELGKARPAVLAEDPDCGTQLA